MSIIQNYLNAADIAKDKKQTVIDGLNAGAEESVIENAIKTNHGDRFNVATIGDEDSAEITKQADGFIGPKQTPEPLIDDIDTIDDEDTIPSLSTEEKDAILAGGGSILEAGGPDDKEIPTGEALKSSRGGIFNQVSEAKGFRETGRALGKALTESAEIQKVRLEDSDFVQFGEGQGLKKEFVGNFDRALAMGEVALSEVVGGLKKITGTEEGGAEEGAFGEARGSEAYEGIVDVLSGVLGIPAAGFAALLPSEAETVVEGIFGFLGKLGGGGVKKVIEKSGGDPESQNSKNAIRMGALLGMLWGPKVAKLTLKSLDVGIPEVLEKGAEKGVIGELAPTKTKFKIKAQKVAPRLRQEQIVAFDRTTLKKRFGKKAQEFGELIEKESKTLEGDIKTSTLVEKLEEAKKEFQETGDKGQIVDLSPESTTAITNLQAKMLEFGDKIPAQKARHVRQIFDKFAKKHGRFDGTKTIEILEEVDYKSMVADAIRDQLAKDNPTLAALNKEYHFYRDVFEILRDTTDRKTGQAPPLGKRGAQGVGAMVASAKFEGFEAWVAAYAGAVVAGKMSNLMNSTLWNTVGISLKQKLANAIRDGNKGLTETTLAEIAVRIKSEEAKETSKSKEDKKKKDKEPVKPRTKLFQ